MGLIGAVVPAANNGGYGGTMGHFSLGPIFGNVIVPISYSVGPSIVKPKG